MQSDDNNLFSNEELEVLMVFFLDQASLILEAANKSLLALEENSEDAEAMSSLQRALHTLKGDANSVGFNEIGTLAHKLEDLLSLISQVEPNLKREILDLSLSGIDALGDIVQRKGQWLHNPIDISGKLEPIEQFLLEHEEGKKEKAKSDRALVELGEYQTLWIKNAINEGKHALQIEVQFDEDCSMHAAGALILCRQLEPIGEIVGTFPDINEDEILEESSHITVVLITKKPEVAQAATLVAGVTAAASITPLVIASDKVISERRTPHQSGEQSVSAAEPVAGQASDLRATELLAAIGQSDKEAAGIETIGGTQTAAPLAAVQRADRPTRSSAIKPTIKTATEVLRVDAGKVDTLMDLVGELVISRSMLNQICAQLKSEFPKHEQVARLADADSYIGRVLGELQKGVMQVRMVSLDQVFNRFFRIVRDLGRDGGKQINLEIVGEETELDKRVVDIIYEPLLHLVRNAVDHGIEPSNLRTKEGKPQNGHVALRAYHQGDQVVIEVEDDGGGIDIEKLKIKALEKGLRTSEELKALQGQDAVELIFLSSLSTAGRVTEVSGRGVGMDVVKSVVDSLKGNIEIWSELGRGTRFTLRLPLTLAIIKSMLFSVENRVFAIPLSTVIEIARVHQSEIEQIGRHKVYSLRETLYSLLELDRLLLRIPRAEMREHVFILIIGFGERRVGLVVDRVIGEREIVVKAIDKEWVSSDLVTGASILGDGRVVLILDVSALLRRAVIAARSTEGV